MTPNTAAGGIRQIEEFAETDSFFHRRHPLAVLISCICFIIVTVSFPKYSFAQILPMALYPLAVFYYTDIPVKPVIKTLLPVLPLIVGIGIFNPFFDTNKAAFNGLTFSLGWVSFASLLIKGLLCSITALLMASTVGINGITRGMGLLKIPKQFITQFALTFRYIQTLSEEAGRISLAYRIRSNGKRVKVPSVKEWGIMAGSWLLRTLSRADRIYNAMLLRGYNGILPGSQKKLDTVDLCYMLLCCGLFLFIRLVNIPNLIGNLIIGG